MQSIIPPPPTQLPARRRAGLSISHISGRGSLTLAAGGSLAQLTGHRPKGRPPGPRPPRGQCGPYNRRSRGRFMQRMAAIPKRRFRKRSWFITLTYPEIWPSDPAEWKRHLDNWFYVAHAAYPTAAFAWRLEPQARGAPHYHLLAFGIEDLDRDWLSRTWYEVVGSNDPRHLRAGTNRERLRSWAGVLSYAAKYLGKVDGAPLPPGWERVGRWWGIRYPANLHIDLVSIPLRHSEFLTVRRTLARYLRAQWRDRPPGSRRHRPSARRDRFQGLWLYAPDDLMIGLLRLLTRAYGALPDS